MKDYIVRATAANAQIRAFAVTSKELVECARSAHNLSPGDGGAWTADDGRRDDGKYVER